MMEPEAKKERISKSKVVRPKSKPQPLDSMSVTKAYIQRICQNPLITKEEEIDLAGKIHFGTETEKEGASKKLIESNLRLVVKIAHEFRHYGLPLRDLISAGSVGLIHAAEKFDPEKGARFATYAVWWIKQSIRRALDAQSSTIRIPVQSAAKLKKIKMAHMKLAKKFDREPTNEEIAEYLDFSVQTVNSLRHADLHFFSLDESIQSGEEGEFKDIIPDKNAINPAQMMGEIDSLDQVKHLMGKLAKRERFVIEKRFGLDGEDAQTLEEIANEIGITRERVRQIQNKAFYKIRKMLKQ